MTVMIFQRVGGIAVAVFVVVENEKWLRYGRGDCALPM